MDFLFCYLKISHNQLKMSKKKKKKKTHLIFYLEIFERNTIHFKKNKKNQYKAKAV
jgi:hypothetical protein